jgi:hypothetical protein
MLFGCSSTQEEGLRQASEAPSALAARLPAEAAGFARGEAALPDPEATSVEVAYATRGRHAAGATVLLARRPGAEPPPPDLALQDLVQDALRPQPHRQARERGARFPVPAAGTTRLRLVCTETEGVYGRERVEGLLCAGTLGSTGVQLRLTMPRRNPAAADARGFAATVAATLAATPASATR